MQVEKNLNILGATLLSVEEAEHTPLNLREYRSWWWLKSAGDVPFNVAYIRDSGSINRNGNFIGRSNVYIRPALRILMLDSAVKIGDCFRFGGKEFQIISNDLAFCKSDIGEYHFYKDWDSEDANDYEKSDVKRFVDEWFTKVTKGE